MNHSSVDKGNGRESLLTAISATRAIHPMPKKAKGKKEESGVRGPHSGIKPIDQDGKPRLVWLLT